MRPPTCVACGLAVLELRGQYARFDSYLISGGVPAAETAGTWHVVCLANSAAGLAWGSALITNYLTVRGFEWIADAAEWVVVRNPRTRHLLALSRSGDILELGLTRTGIRRVAGGLSVPERDREYGLEYERGLVGEIQAALRTESRYPLLRLADRLGIRSRLAHPELLDRAEFRYDPELEPEWQPGFVYCPVEYNVFVPESLMPWTRA